MKASNLWINGAAACAVELQSGTKPTFLIGDEPYLEGYEVQHIAFGLIEPFEHSFCWPETPFFRLSSFWAKEPSAVKVTQTHTNVQTSTYHTSELCYIMMPRWPLTLTLTSFSSNLEDRQKDEQTGNRKVVEPLRWRGWGEQMGFETSCQLVQSRSSKGGCGRRVAERRTFESRGSAAACVREQGSKAMEAFVGERQDLVAHDWKAAEADRARSEVLQGNVRVISLTLSDFKNFKLYNRPAFNQAEKRQADLLDVFMKVGGLSMSGNMSAEQEKRTNEHCVGHRKTRWKDGGELRDLESRGAPVSLEKSVINPQCFNCLHHFTETDLQFCFLAMLSMR